MERKSVSCTVLSLILIVILVWASEVTWAGASVLGLGRLSIVLQDQPPKPRIVFQQNFDNETPGQVPSGWTVLEASSSVGNFTVVNSTDYVVLGKSSAKFLDNSTTGSPVAYRNFTQQNGTIIVSFALNIPNSTGNNTGLEVSVDEGGFNGANIILGDGVIQYFDGANGLVTLRSSYAGNAWYRIKFIINIGGGIYNIYIDEHLEIAGARFNGSASQIHRIAIAEFSGAKPPGSLLPIGYIDDIEVRVGITIPNDFPTIQAGIDAANPGDLVYVTPRVYFENVIIISKQDGMWLVGQDTGTTVIDGRFATAVPYRISLMGCSNVTVYGFTIRFSAANGAQVRVDGGSNNTITSNMIFSGLGDGISVSGSGNVVSNNVINSTVHAGIRVVGSNSTINDNVVQSSQVGIDLSGGVGNLARNNTLEANGVAVQCETGADDGLIYRNRFVGNGLQALDNGISNEWDDGYPYVVENWTGGGNYWSDLSNCTDVFSGPGQNELVNYTFSPDDICDQPYSINSKSMDHYPLFLIQSVVQNPKLNHVNYTMQAFDKSVDYAQNVTVTATTLKLVKISSASLGVDYATANGTTHVTIAMQVSGNSLIGVIPHQPYGTTVTYNVSAVASNANRLNSTNYPLPFPYFADDMTPPSINNVTWVPSGPDESQTITVIANVAEPQDASQVYKVYASFLVNFTSWTAEMTKDANNYTAVIPKQPGNATLNFNVTAVDRAGNWAPPKNNTQYVMKLAHLFVVNGTGAGADNPCRIDFGIVSGDQKISTSFNVTNLSGKADEFLIWNVTTVVGGPWLKSVDPLGGNLKGGQSMQVKATVDTHGCSDAGVYIAELLVNATGAVPQWAVILTFTVRNIIIDLSWGSSEAPSRSNLNMSQYFAFHAEWGSNSSDATGGSIKITGTSYVQVNATGWALFNYSSPKPANITFGVEGVKFDNITSFIQTAANRTTIWDSVKIALTMGNDGYVNVGSIPSVSWNGSYHELDNTTFNGAVVFNDSLIRNNVDTSWVSASSIIDYDYPSLTAFESPRALNITWVQPTSASWWQSLWLTNGNVTNQQVQPVQTQSGGAIEFWIVLIIVLVGIGIFVTLLLLVSSGKKSKSSNGKKKVGQTNQNDTYVSKH